ncbi:rhomboid family intramembrane serine protease [Pseudooceanicola nanhaiensis]|jgi:membrane associated rhomboid family serine protease|uniref:Rhomboid family intramembrane serine protease n=1 Tax=Pseudooceanicola nanhaiensis TaxID=375761 RepID=A0A917SSU3_9RHOB|nr:rhomboid family intramembrane serine protease [Pseudooceanicola nanhaiensis]GGL96054.1 rhomboid family intramembrane serine protease [Pseudooceanicola nanhaiensis]
MAIPDHDIPRAPRPVNPLPWSVVLLFLAIAAVEIVLSLGARGIIGGPGSVGWRLEAIRSYGFVSAVLHWMMEQGVWPLEQVMRFVTYPFVHGAFTSAAFACVMLLALGKWVGEVAGAWSVLITFFLSSVLGALVYGLVTNDAYPLIGAFPGIYGLIGVFTWLLWVRLKASGDNEFRAFTLIGVLMGIQLVFGLLFGAANTWVADITGAVAGFLAAPLLVPGGWSAFLRRMRRD